MAIFGKPTNFATLQKKVQSHAYIDLRELEVLLEQLAAHPEAHPKKLLWMLQDPNPRVREFGFQVIASKTKGQIAEILLGAMSGADGRVRQELATKLIRLDLAMLYRALGPMVHSKRVEHRRTALEVISRHEKWKEFLGFLKRTIKDPEPSLRLISLNVLSMDPKDQTIRMLLLDLVLEEDRDIRHQAIAALAAHPGPDLVEPFFARLVHETPQWQKRMVDALGEVAATQSAKLEEKLLPILGSDDEKLRDCAVNLLAKMPNRTEVLRNYLVQARGLAVWLRERTAESILTLSNSMIQPLIELMEDDDFDVSVGAMMMAAESDDKRIVPTVTNIFLAGSDWWVRSIAAEVLGKFADREVLQLLISKLPDEDVRYTIISILGKHLGPATIPHLLACLEDPQRSIRVAAMEALQGAEDAPEVPQKVYTLAADDPEKMVREKAANVLESFADVGATYLKKLGVVRQQQQEARLGRIELEMVNEALNE